VLYVIQRPFGRITSMPVTGQERTSSERAESGLSSQCRRPVQRLCHTSPRTTAFVAVARRGTV